MFRIISILLMLLFTSPAFADNTTTEANNKYNDTAGYTQKVSQVTTVSTGSEVLGVGTAFQVKDGGDVKFNAIEGVAIGASVSGRYTQQTLDHEPIVTGSAASQVAVAVTPTVHLLSAYNEMSVDSQTNTFSTVGHVRSNRIGATAIGANASINVGQPSDNYNPNPLPVPSDPSVGPPTTAP